MRAHPSLRATSPAATAVAATLLLAWSAGAQTVTPGQVRPGSLAGSVRDHVTRKPLPSARIFLVPVDGSAPGVSAETDASGAFAFPSLAPVTYVIRVTALGYGEVADTVRIVAGEEPFAEITLAPEALDLEPVTVSVEARRPMALKEFDDRRATGVGTFFTRQEIAAQRVARVSDLLRRVSGVSVETDVRGNQRLRYRGRCEPTLYLDGVAAGTGVNLDVILRPDHIEALEVHSNATAPAKYARDACAVLLIWTRVPERTTGGGSWWRGLAVAGVIITLVLLGR